MSPIRVFVVIWVIYGIVVTAMVMLLAAVIFLTWLFRPKEKL